MKNIVFLFACAIAFISSNVKAQMIGFGDRLITPKFQLCPTDLIEEDDLSINFLTNYLTKNTKVKDVNTLLRCLPDSLFDHYVLVDDSLAPEAGDVNIENPRVILFTEDTRFILAYTGIPDGHHTESIQVIEYDQQNYQYNFAKFEFTGLTGYEYLRGNNGRLGSFNPKNFRSTINSEECIACHSPGGRNDARPIWGDYRGWSNALGEESDGEWADTDQDQYFAFVSFLKEKRNHSRYQRLIQAISNYQNLFGYWSVDDLSDEEFTPRAVWTPKNREFNLGVSAFNGERISYAITEHENFEQYKYFWTAAFLSCRLSDAVEQDFLNRFGDQEFAEELVNIYLDTLDSEYLHDRDDGAIAILSILSEYFGINRLSWDTLFFGLGRNNDYWFFEGPGMQVVPEARTFVFYYFVEEIIRNLDDADPLKVQLLSVNWSDYYEGDLDLSSRVEVQGYDSFDAICETLEPRLIDELELR